MSLDSTAVDGAALRPAHRMLHPLRAAAPKSRALVALLAALGLLLGASALHPAAAAGTTCSAGQPGAQADYRNRTLENCNFNGADLSGANFSGATLSGVIFIRAKLTGADFSAATFQAGPNPVLAADFSFADLSGAKFIGTRFNGTTYLTYATLACTDFSNTLLNSGHAIFGDEPLVLGAASGSCRTRFQGSTMNCEFVSQWDQLDLNGADISACVAQLQSSTRATPFDFSGGVFTNVVFDKLDLSATRWAGAKLEGASFQGAKLDGATGLNGTAGQPSHLSKVKFNNASVKNVDLSHAQLYGATFDNANLSGSNLSGSFLTANAQATPPIVTAASFTGAHMKDVSLANARLSGTSFQYSSFYSSFGGGTPSFPCSPQASSGRRCATASGADLTDTNFGNAYLYGVDFSGTTTVVNGTHFGSAVLVAANFSGASFQVNGGAAPDFTQALLQGAQFDGNAAIGGSSLQNAFLDFGAAGNTNVGNLLMLRLSSAYTGFNGWSGAPTP
ncbi:MAG: pentapeptide repeat-containing protein, partial [Burkholderiaceae bacterium]